MLKAIDTLLDRIFAVIGAVIFSQGPAFIQQYTQRLAGIVEELSRHVGKMKKIAEGSGKTLSQYVEKFLQSSDPDFQAQGELIQSMISRLDILQGNLVAIKEASVFTRPFTFLYRLNRELFASTLEDYQLGISITIEGIVYALIGLVVGYGTYTGIRRIVMMVYQKTSSLFKNKENSDQEHQ